MDATKRRLNWERYEHARLLLGPLWAGHALALRFDDATGVTGTPGESTQPAPGIGETTPPATETTPQGTEEPTVPGVNQPPLAPAPTDQPGPVPYERFKEVNDQRRAYEEYILRQRQQPQQPTPGQPTQPSQEDVLRQLGMTADDLFTDDGLRRYTQGVMQLTQQGMMQAVQQLRTEMAQMMNQSQTPDFAQVVGGQNPITGEFQYGGALQNYMNAHPDQAQALAYMARLPQTQRIVYDLITRDPSFQRQREQTTQQQVNRQVQQINTRAVSASELPQAGNLDEAEIRRNWSEAQVQANVERARQQTG